MKQLFKKYLIAIYFIIAALSVITWLIGYYHKEQDVYQSTLINLATELLGAVLVFFLVNFFFQVDEIDTNQRIEKLLNKLEKEDQTLAQNFFINQPDMEKFILNSKQIDICGVALTVFVDKGLGALRKAIQSGAKIRIMLIEKSDYTYNAAALRSETGKTSYYEKKHASTFDNLDYLHKYTASLTNKEKGSIEVGLLKYPPSFGIEIFQNLDNNPNSGKLKIEIYAHHTGWDKPPIFMLDKISDDEWFKYFVNQFEVMWERSEKYTIEV
jgi:hypothetical protein